MLNRIAARCQLVFKIYRRHRKKKVRQRVSFETERFVYAIGWLSSTEGIAKDQTLL